MDGASSAPAALRRQLRHALLFVAALTVPASFRLALCSESTVLISAADLLGLYVDLCVTGAWVLLVILVGSKSRWAAYTLMMMWCLLHAANYEHVRALGTMPSLNHIGQLAEPAFLWGSATVLSRPFLLAALLLLTIAALRQMQNAWQLDRQTAWFAALMLSQSLGLPLRHDCEQSAQWRQTHPLAMNLSRLWNQVSPPSESTGTSSHDIRHRVRRLVHTDLSGRSIVPAIDRPQNVLLVVLEGVSGAHIEPISRAQGLKYPSPMPRLSELAAENMAWTQFVAQQRQTDRGLYSIMAGRYPQLNHAPSLMSNYVPDPHRPALPAVLREAGYETVFLQAADLDYMQKGRFMRSAGFDRVLGSESFQTSHFRTGWGPDDLTVMEKGYELIRGLQGQAKPWFLTVFTAGTHHPYEVPGDFRSGFQPGTFEHTAAYADAAVAELLSRLRQDGTLDNTLVLITSDESSGVQRKASDLDCEVSHNWGFLVAITPDRTRQRVDEPFMQSDLALSIVDYLGLASRPHRFVGRSAFRHYEEPRPILCANVYFGTVTLFDVDGSVSICPDDFHGGRTYRLSGPWLFGGNKATQPWDPSKTDFMTAVVRYSLGSANHHSVAQHRSRRTHTQ